MQKSFALGPTPPAGSKPRPFFLEFRDGNVLLNKRDGSIVKVPSEKLSKEDQEWVKLRLPVADGAEKQRITKDQVSESRTQTKERAGAKSDNLDGKWWLVEAERDGKTTGSIVIVASRRCLIIEGTKFIEVAGEGMRGQPILETWQVGYLQVNSASNPKEIDFRYQDFGKGEDFGKLLGKELGKLENGSVVVSNRKRGKTSKGIYKLEKDALVICVSDGDRPKDFVTKPEDGTELQFYNQTGRGQWRH